MLAVGRLEASQVSTSTFCDQPPTNIKDPVISGEVTGDTPICPNGVHTYVLQPDITPGTYDQCDESNTFGPMAWI